MSDLATIDATAAGDTTAATPRARDRRIDGWDLAFAIVAVVTGIGLLVLGRSLTFYHDDWIFLDGRLEWSLDSFMRPHNQHWILTLVVLWKPLLATVGLASYLPFLAINAVTHIAVAASIYWVVRRLADPAAGLVAGVLMLTLGVGGELLFHAQGANLLLATAFGSWALALTVAARPARPVVVAVLLVLAVASGGPGLFFAVAVATFTGFAPGRLRDLWTVAPAAAAYAVWLIIFGRDAIEARFTAELGDLVALVDWVRDGAAGAAGQVTLFGNEIGLVVIVLLVVATLWQLLGRGPYPYVALAALAGLAAQSLVTGIARMGLAGTPPDAPRYAYTGAVFVLVALAAGYGTRPRPRPINGLPILGLVVAALVLNVQTVRWWADSWYTPRSQETRAAIGVALEHGGTPALPGDRWPLHPTDPFMAAIPAPDRLREVIGILGGDPLDDAWQPGRYPVPPEVLARVEAEILGASEG